MQTLLADLDMQAVPKVLLHEHLDGGLRPGTVIELADAVGYADLPTSDEGETGALVSPRGKQGQPAGVPGRLCAHHRGDADP